MSPCRVTSRRLAGPTTWLALLACIGAPAAAVARADGPDFETHVLPILKARCWKCHGDAGAKAGLDLRTRAGMIRGGETGTALTPGAADKSPLLRRIEAGEMPPAPEAKLAAEHVAVLKAWITAGAPAPDTKSDPATPSATWTIEEGRKHWAFQRLGSPRPPRVRDHRRVRTPVDAFVLARLEPKGLTLAPDADRTALLRRLSLDLLGLPPSPEEIAAFVHDVAPRAYERLVDRLLASPHFGERWGRHWLDGAGYTDVYGGDNDAAIIKLGENKWRYRDYVVASLNRDKPYHQFLTEQLAGDELVDWRKAATFTPETAELLIATGFLRNSPDDTNENELNTPDIRHGLLQRTAEGVANNLLGLTLQCAKCHSHKYEPIPHRDYYGFLALFQPAFNPDRWLQPQQRQLPAVSPAEKSAIERHNAELEQEVKKLQAQIDAIRQTCRTRLWEARLAAAPEAERAALRQALETPAEKRSEGQKAAAVKFASITPVKPEDVAAALSPADKAAVAPLERQIAACKGQRRGWEHWQAVYDAGPPTPTFVLRRGNHLAPGEEATPGYFAVLCPSDAASAAQPKSVAGESSGRRLALARWLTDSRSAAGALVLRMRVNRVWQHLFGQGIVETPDNFGLTGAPPTHPELLEWLAREFAAQDQQLKPLIRLLVTSTVYRQASGTWASLSETRSRVSERRGHVPGANSADPFAVDPDNRLLWRMRLRRLEAEAVRDSMLAAAGRLDHTIGGPPVPVEPRPDGTFVVPEKLAPSDRFRRSLYLLARRNYHPTLLGVFDQPNLTTACTRRQTSAVVLQSLTMLNDPFVQGQAEGIAQRITAESRHDPAARIEAAFLLTLGRPTQVREMNWSRDFLNEMAVTFGTKAPGSAAEQQGLAHLCHVLLNSSEFLYIP